MYIIDTTMITVAPGTIASYVTSFLMFTMPFSSLQNYTQNIDTLETLAGVQRVLQCHGSFATASCLLCRRCVPGFEIEADILRRKVPLCTVCNAPSSSAISAKKVRGKKKKKKVNEWDSDVEDESDGPDFPPGIMKVLKSQLSPSSRLMFF